MNVAAIDCGTNSTRLLVADDRCHPLERLMRITRLGQGVDATGRLAPEAIDRTVAVLGEYRGVMDRLHVDRMRMTATSAARDAENRDDFFTAARRVIGIEPELLAGDAEGRLAFRGATAELLVGKVLGNPETKQRVEDILDGQRERVREVLAENRDIHAALRDALMEHDELVRDEILEVIEKALANRS